MGCSAVTARISSEYGPRSNTKRAGSAAAVSNGSRKLVAVSIPSAQALKVGRRNSSASGRLSQLHRRPANDRNRRVLVVAGRSDEGPLTKPIAAAQAWWRELVFMPRFGHWKIRTPG